MVNPVVYDTARQQVYTLDALNNRLDIIDAQTQTFVNSIPVGMGPSSLVLAPIPGGDGRTRLYISNSLSDSISVVDLDIQATDASRGVVMATIGGLDANNRTVLDSPVGLAVTADGRTGYVALSHSAEIATLNLTTLTVGATRFSTKAIEPRAIALSADDTTLYIASFIPGNRTQKHFRGTLNGDPNWDEANLDWPAWLDMVGRGMMGADFTADTSVIDVDPTLPDPDVIVLNVQTGESQILSDIASQQWDIKVQGNTVQIAGMAALNLNDRNNFPDDLAGRPYRNINVRMTCTGTSCSRIRTFDTDGEAPTRDNSAAIPSAVAFGQGTGLNQRTYLTAFGSAALIEMNTTGQVLRRFAVGNLPQGVTLNTDGTKAYVLNRGDNTVSVVNLSTGTVSTIALDADPTPPTIKDGRRVFFNAYNSRNGSFACGSCHPNANQDGLVWRLAEGIKSAQTVHHIHGTAPYHWMGSQPDSLTLVTGGFHNDAFQYRQPGEDEIGVPTDCEIAHAAEYIESVDVQPGPPRPITDRMAQDAREGLAVARRGVKMFDDNSILNEFTMDPAMEDRINAWAAPWINVPSGLTQEPIQIFGCAKSQCHEAPQWSSPSREEGVKSDAQFFYGAFERVALGHDGRPYKMQMRTALNNLVDTINAEIDRRNQSLPQGQQVPRLPDSYKIMTDGFRPVDALRGFDNGSFRSDHLKKAQFWVDNPQNSTLLNPFFLIDRIIEYSNEQMTGYSAALGQQVTANPSWNGANQTMLSLLTEAASNHKITLRAQGVLKNAMGQWVRADAVYDPARAVFTDGTRTYTARTLVQQGRSGRGYVNFIATGPTDLTRMPLIHNVVNGTVPPVNGVRQLAFLRSNDGAADLLIRGTGFASGDNVLNDGLVVGRITDVTTLDNGLLEGHFRFTVNPALGGDYYILSIQAQNATTGEFGLTSNEFPVPVVIQ